MSSPTDPPPTSAPKKQRTTAPRPSPFRVNPRRMVLLFLLILIGPCVVVQVPLEIGRWKYAAAIEARQQGNAVKAYQQLGEAMRWIPNSPHLFDKRAMWRLADGQREGALADAERIFQIYGETAEGYSAYGTLLQHAGEFTKGVEFFNKANQASQLSGRPSRSMALNNLAYSQALAKAELDQALQNVNESLALLSKEEVKHGGRAQLLDTRGYVLYQKGQYTSALNDLNQALQIIEPAILVRKAEYESLPGDARKHFGLFPELQMLAVLYYHRALIHEALGNEQPAAADRERAKVLIGREPDETLF